VRLLVLGGTVFLGRHVVEAALARGHDVTILHRGVHGAGLFEGRVARLAGDRDRDVSALRGRAFDAVVDCSGYTPQQVRLVADALGLREAAGAAPHVVFVSSLSAYGRFEPGRVYDEATPLATGDAGYGPLKARAEEAVVAATAGRATIVRPGLIVGPHDPSGRFTYWPERVAHGGEVLAPGRPGRPVQWIDVRDLAPWCVTLAESRAQGAFNAVGPRVPMAELLAACREVAASDARFTWVPDDALLALGVVPWTGLPLWLPESDPAFGGMMLAELARARAAGLRTRDARETIAATLAWARAPREPGFDASKQVATLAPGREAEILAGLARPAPSDGSAS
jgi:2'-hydroxyisoflavone reductase